MIDIPIMVLTKPPTETRDKMADVNVIKPPAHDPYKML